MLSHLSYSTDFSDTEADAIRAKIKEKIDNLKPKMETRHFIDSSAAKALMRLWA